MSFLRLRFFRDLSTAERMECLRECGAWVGPDPYRPLQEAVMRRLFETVGPEQMQAAVNRQLEGKA